jgi:glycogen debranching enzyme
MKPKKKPSLLSLFLLAFLFSTAPAEESENRSSSDVMAGLSNHGKTKDEAYVAAGDRTYLIGTQDGNFPDLGRHVEGEMGGLWVHPIKLMDGFWVKLTDLTTGEEYPLTEASEFINYPYGNKFLYAPGLNGVEVERFQFCPDKQLGLVVQYLLKNRAAEKIDLKFEFLAKTDLSPVWLSEKLGIKDSNDDAVWDASKRVFIARDSGNPWFAVWGTAHPVANRSIGTAPLPQKTIGKGIATSAAYNVSIDKNSSVRLTFVLAGSPKSEQEAFDSYIHLIENHDALLVSKKKHYTSILHRTNIKIPDQAMQDVFAWNKINLEWLVRDVPEIGRGLAAGLPEYPWWFGTDSTYSLQAVMATGDFELAKQTLRLLKNVSMKENGNGRIVHEVATNGVVYNPGNTQETAHFIICVEKLFRWSGDLAFIREMYPVMKMGIRWLLQDMDQNKNLFPEGYGIMEVYGLNAELIDVAVYTQQALKATAYIAGILNEPEVQKEYQQLSAKLAEKINANFWDPAEESYCDFFGNKAQAIRAAEGAITQIKRNHPEGMDENANRKIEFYESLKLRFSKMPDVEKGWLTNKNWVITTPMETGIAPEERAIKLLKKIRHENIGEHGPFLSAVERTAMMTISTGVQAVSEYKYGRTDEAMWYVDKIVQTFNRVLPGSITEMMPDYGDFTQAWTSYGVVLPIVEHVFGIQPDALNNSVLIEPHLPTGWENISIENVPIGSNFLWFSRAKTKKGTEYVIKGKNTGWKYVLKLPIEPGAKYYLNGQSVSFNPSGIRMTAKNNVLLVRQ